VDTEIAWVGTAYLREDDDERWIYVDEVYTCEQRVHGTEAELTVDGQAEMTTKLITEDLANNVPEAEWRTNHLRVWGH
jgi:hypothetical protein